MVTKKTKEEKAIFARLRENVFSSATWGVYADWLEDHGKDSTIVREIAEYFSYQDRELVVISDNALKLVWPLVSATKLTEVFQQLKVANGRRLVRKLSKGRVIEFVLRDRKNDPGSWAAICGGRVTNSYQYPAATTVCLIVAKKNGKFRVAITSGDAKESSSFVTPFGISRCNAPVKEFVAWAEEKE